MSQASVDLPKLRAALRKLNRDDLLVFAERAVEAAAATGGLTALVGDRVQIPYLEGEPPAVSLLDEARSFHAASLRGEYYEDFEVNWKNSTQRSKGTDAFMAETDRLIARCLKVAKEGDKAQAREALELLFDLFRRIDRSPDEILFFADEAGSWQLPVVWETVLPVYFECAAAGSTAEDYARLVDQTIADFAEYERGELMIDANRVASPEQQAALAALPPRNAG